MTDAEKIAEIQNELFNRIKSLEKAIESSPMRYVIKLFVERKSEATLIQKKIDRIVKGENV